MRRLEHLIKDVRFNSDNIETSRFDDINLLKIFNDAQSMIQSLIVKRDSSGKYFPGTDLVNIVASTEEYSLPTDAFAENFISSVSTLLSNSLYDPLPLITLKEKNIKIGYIISGSVVILSPLPSSSITDGLQIKYVKKLPTLSYRVGRIQSYISATSITLVAGYVDTDFTEYEDFVTVVDVNGVVKQAGIRVALFAGGVITTTDALTGIAANDYVVVGKYATSHSGLPDVCEGILTSLVNRMMFAYSASSEFNIESMLTADQRAIIEDLFARADHDVKYPPVTNGEFLNY